MNKIITSFINGILAGICISIGGTAFLMTDNKFIGAILFTVGLFTICTLKFNLYTGKVCYVFENKPSYTFLLLPIWFGNLLGTFLTAKAELLTRIGPALSEKADKLCDTKLSDNLLSIFILSFFCNILIYIAVECFAKCPNDIGKYIGLFFGVVVFIICGFEHCVANMYYFSVASKWSLKTLLYVMTMTAGNSVGGIFIPAIRLFLNKAERKQTK